MNLDEVVAALPVPSPIRSRIDETISSPIPDREFDLDPGIASRLVRKRRFEADYGVRVVVPAEFYDQMVRVDDVPGSEPRLRRVIIEIQKWQET